MKAVKAKPKFCSICTQPIDKQRTEDGTVYWEGGHNAEPIAKGSCCEKCNVVVTMARLAGINPYSREWSVLQALKKRVEGKEIAIKTDENLEKLINEVFRHA